MLYLRLQDDPRGGISVETFPNIVFLIEHSIFTWNCVTVVFVVPLAWAWELWLSAPQVLYPWEFKTVFNNQLHILINLGKYVIAGPNHLWGYKNQLWSLTFSTLDYKQFTSRASNGSRLSAFVQISALFQIYITDMSRHLHHLTKCPFEVKKGLKGLFLHWEVIANKQTLPYFVLPSGLRLLCRHWGFCADIVQLIGNIDPAT